jgi:hypothetical protein
VLTGDHPARQRTWLLPVSGSEAPPNFDAPPESQGTSSGIQMRFFSFQENRTAMGYAERNDIVTVIALVAHG